MKRYFSYVVIFLFSMMACSISFAAEEKYRVDPQHSFVVWRVDHLGFSTQTGKWPATGFILLNKNDPTKSKVDITIKIANLITGIEELNNHLKKPIFFDAEKYPTATFVSHKIKLLSKNKAEVEGSLTIHGVTKPIKLNVFLNKMGKNPVNEKMSVGFSTKTSIKRSDYNIKGFLPMVGDKVHLAIDVEAQKESE